MQWCFDTPKAGQLSCVASPSQKEKIKIVILLILNVLAVMKVIFKKQEPKIIFCRNYKNFDKKSFKGYLKLSLEAYDPSEFALKDFQNVCLTSLNSFPFIKKNM